MTENKLLSYSYFVSSRTKAMNSPLMDELHMAVGVAGEAGELLDAIKKAWIYGLPLDVENVVEELGDILFYVQGLCNVLRVPIGDVIDHNIEKLSLRYPHQYSDEDAAARRDKEHTGDLF